MQSSIRIFPIDFTKPWWKIITAQLGLLIGISICVLIRDIFWVFMPFMITLLFEQQSWYLLAGFCVLWLIIFINFKVFGYITPRFQLQTIHSILNNAHRYLLTVDPQYHVKRSGGEVLAKIDRAARGYEDVLDQITFSFVPLVISIVTMLTIFANYSLLLMLAIAGCLIGMIGYGYYFARYACHRWEQAFITSDDAFKNTAFENLSQIHMIRATFATDYAQTKLDQRVAANSSTEEKLWLAYISVSNTLNIIYGISIILLAIFFIHSLKLGQITLPYAVSIILAYIQSTFQLIKIVQPMRHYIRGMTAINDLFAFMPRFGRQTIPVVSLQEETPDTKDSNSLVASNITFGYGDAPLFDNITLQIHCTPEQKNKLYGIVGPSGAGKTTLLAMLGGQLKPTSGTVYINDIDIYAVGDAERRQLITLQGQIATSIKGTLRYNLLFGLPANHGYTDAYLIDILSKLGLEQVLTQHQGLDTLLGEGALNISGGQRQRLNFAGLYLRARFYRPAVILIDEPTSSLDELSELAVTKMITELAENAITLVIAHRLKTLEHAVGLIDISLTAPNTILQPRKTDELKAHSA